MNVLLSLSNTFYLSLSQTLSTSLSHTLSHFLTTSLPSFFSHFPSKLPFNHSFFLGDFLSLSLSLHFVDANFSLSLSRLLQIIPLKTSNLHTNIFVVSLCLNSLVFLFSILLVATFYPSFQLLTLNFYINFSKDILVSFSCILLSSWSFYLGDVRVCNMLLLVHVRYLPSTRIAVSHDIAHKTLPRK